MGYYTDYEISAENTTGIDMDEVESRLHEISGYTGLSFSDVYNCKWYGMEEDMLKLSLEFPQITFYVEGSGEEQGDTWKAIFKNGISKTVRPVVVWPDLTLD